MTISIVVADDQPVIAAGFAALLDAQEGLEVVGTASNGQELVDLVAREDPDVALVDVRMPVMDGIAATALITASSATRVLILTTFDLDEYVYEAIKAGASGFLLKDVTGERLIEGVRLVSDGSVLLGPAVSRRLIADFCLQAQRTEGRSRPIGLSAREEQVLLALGEGRNNAEIAESLVIGVETVKSHVSVVLRKLGLRDRIQAVVYCYENGLILPGD